LLLHCALVVHAV
jgi:hypothetical protein